MSQPTNLAYLLNENCHCNTLDVDQLRVELDQSDELAAFVQNMSATHPHLFSATQVFISESTYRAIVQAVETLERVTSSRTWRDYALQGVAPVASDSPGALGVFMGYDFHVDESPDRQGAAPVHLIEINTNAGGALLSTALARAQHLCCNASLRGLQPATALKALDDRIFAMFQNEWRLQRGDLPWRTVAIVDDGPASQFLAPEFALFQALFAARGIQAFVADPSSFSWTAGRLALTQGGQTHSIDLVYNRLTDFDLSRPEHLALREAYIHRAAVVTPHPHAHALKANKRHLVSLSDPGLLDTWGVSLDDRAVLHRVVPHTVLVDKADPDELWTRRRHLFFKPLAGFAGKAAFRGDKITRKTWALIQSGGFVAQDIVAPGERVVAGEGAVGEGAVGEGAVGGDLEGADQGVGQSVDQSVNQSVGQGVNVRASGSIEPAATSRLKFDVRAYVYDGQIQHLVARVYSGQTTNMSSVGGGFAPVAVVPDLRWPDGSTACRDCTHH